MSVAYKAAEADPVAEADLAAHNALKRGVHGFPSSVGSGQGLVGDGSGGWSAVDVATQAEQDAAIAAHEADTSNVHGIADTTKLQLLDVSQTRTADLRFTGAKLGIGMAPSATIPLSVKSTGTDWTGYFSGAQHAGYFEQTEDLVGLAVDTVNVYHRGTGDGVYVAHLGGKVAAATFTATTTNGSATLSGVSSYAGLTKNVPITGTGIPGGTTVAATPSAAQIAAGTLTMSAPATASGSITLSVAASGTVGGNAAFNALIPGTLDDTDGSGYSGGVTNNRTGQCIALLQSQPTGSAGLILNHYGSFPAVYINNQPTAGGHPRGNGTGLSIDDASTVNGIAIAKAGVPDSSSAALYINNTSGSTIDMLRVATTGTTKARIKSDGQLVLGGPTNIFAARAQIEFSAAGIQRNLALTNGNGADSDGMQIEFTNDSAQYALIQGVVDSRASSHGSLRLHAKAAGSMREMVRLDGVNDRVQVFRKLLLNDINVQLSTVTGTKIGTATNEKLAFWNTTPIVQPSGTPAAATDLATVITLANSLRTSLLNVGMVA